MSTTTPPAWPGELAIEPTTAESLRRFAARRRLLLIGRGLAAGTVVFLAAVAVIALCDYLWLLPPAARWTLSLAGYAAAAAAVWWFGGRGAAARDPRALARQLESLEPRLREQLLSAIELADPRLENGSPALRRRLQRRVAQRMATLDPKRLLPMTLIRRWVAAAVAMAILGMLLLWIPELQFGRRAARAMLPGAAIQRASLTELRIVQPEPPSGVVAHGDSVGVIAAVGGEPAGEVSLRFYSADGALHQRPMTPRQTAAQTRGPEGEQTYALNLPVGSAPVEYQVLAGDAATLWHTLTPRPRPRVESFEKRYRFPGYARLEDRVVAEDHGDLEALTGTVAEVTVRFDQPVRDAVLRYSSQADGVPLQPVEDSARQFAASIPIRMPAQYQIDAVGIRSGLNNPFSPQHRITPVPDRPPEVAWSDDLAPTTLVSPLEVLSLAATVQDDLPVERVIQEYQVNGGAWKQRSVTVTEPARALSLRWSWDLMRPGGDTESPLELSAGDTVRSRVIAVDRRASRGTSPTIEFLVTDPSFDRQRHRRLQQRREWSLALMSWLGRAEKLAGRSGSIVELAEQEPVSVEAVVEETDSLAAAVEDSAEQAEQLREHSGTLLEGAETAAGANDLERLARAADDLDRRLRRLSGQWNSWSARLGQLPAQTRQELSDRSKRQAEEIASAAQRTAASARALHAHRLAAGLLNDLVAVGDTLQPLIEEASEVPAGRLHRYGHLVVGQLEAIDQLAQQHEAAIPDSTRRQHTRWLSLSEDWKQRLRAAIGEMPGETQWRSLFSELAGEIDQYARNEVHDGRVAAQVREMVRRLPQQLGWFRERLARLRELGRQQRQLREQVAASGDSAEASSLGHGADFAGERFALDLRLLDQRLRHTESLHRRRGSLDLRYAADLNLLQRALEQVTADGFQPYRDEPPETVIANLAGAFHQLETIHAADQWRRELAELVQAERYLQRRVAAEIEHPLWIDRIGEGLPGAARALRSGGADTEIVETIEQIPSSGEFQQARQQITARRYSDTDALPVDALLAPAAARFAEAMRRLDEPAAAAREVIRRYLATLPEQARQAAEEAEQARGRTDQREDSTAATAEALAEQQRAVERAVDATLRSLADKANTADWGDARERQLARDADAAAAKIRAEARRLDEATAEAAASQRDAARDESLEQTEQTLEDLAGALRQTAEHFDRAARGESLDQSRQVLRQDAPDDAPDDAAADPLQQAREAVEQLAEDAQRSPEELMEQLERELESNRPMREELDDIARRSADLAQRSVDRAAQEQRALHESLERSDPAFRERKELLRGRLAALAERAAEVEQALLGTAQRAVGWANDPSLRPQIEQARRRLRESAEQARSLHPDRTLLQQLQSTSAEIAEAVGEARETADAVVRRSAQLAEEDIHQDPERRQQSEQQMRDLQRESRNQRAGAITQQREHWNDVQREAGRRIQQAQRRQRQAEQTRRRAEDRLEQQPDEPAAEKQRAQAQRELRAAQQAIEAAQATRQFADERADQTAQRQEQLKQRELPQLDKPNPASQLAESLSDEARGELDQIAGELEQFDRDARFDDRLRVPSEQAERLADQQQQIQRRVERAAEHLRRAGRHGQRLGQNDTADQLSRAAESLEQNAGEQAQRARESLESAAQASDRSPEASRQVRRATEQFQQQADALAEMLGTPRAGDPSSGEAADPPEEPSPQEVAQGSEQPGGGEDDAPPAGSEQSQQPPADDSGSGQPDARQRSGRQLARTLDELDRSMHASPGGETAPEPAEPSESADAQRSPSRTAGESSPTLDSALQQQLQRAARQRGRENRAANSASTAASGAGQQAGRSGPPDSGDSALDPERFRSDASQWGQLRQQRTEDAVERASVPIPSQYHREIEAYFQAVAERAAQRSEGDSP